MILKRKIAPKRESIDSASARARANAPPSQSHDFTQVQSACPKTRAPQDCCGDSLAKWP